MDIKSFITSIERFSNGNIILNDFTPAANSLMKPYL